MCKTIGCNVSPSYGLPGGPRQYCKGCKTDDMVYLARKVGKVYKSEQCQKDGCSTRPNFGVIEGKKQFCAEHAEPGMIDLNAQFNRPCQEPECTVKRPNFGMPGETAMFCGKHKKEGMVDVRHKICAHDGCTTQPNFGFLEDGKATHCRNHAENGMVDVKNRQCEDADCTAQPNYGFLGEQAVRCVRHKLEGMEDVKNPRCNDESGCTRQPSFGLEGDVRPTKCAVHKDDRMINMHNYSCVSCKLFHVPKREGLCSYCNPKSTKASRTKENVIGALLEEKISDVKFVQNRSTADIKACGDRSFRPDFQHNLQTHIVMLECDEYFHKDYEVECELARLVALAMSGGGLPIIIIRHNPDGFKIAGKRQLVSQETRNKKLIERVRHHLRTVPEQLLTVEYLFYDDERQTVLEKETEAVMKNYK